MLCCMSAMRSVGVSSLTPTGEVMSWRVVELTTEGVLPMPGQPLDGFTGPGRALRWYQDQGHDPDRLGMAVQIQDNEGRRPFGSNPRRREHAVV